MIILSNFCEILIINCSWTFRYIILDWIANNILQADHVFIAKNGSCIRVVFVPFLLIFLYETILWSPKDYTCCENGPANFSLSSVSNVKYSKSSSILLLLILSDVLVPWAFLPVFVTLFAPEIECLAYLLAKEGIKPVQKKIHAVLDLQPPTTLKELHNFPGFF